MIGTGFIIIADDYVCDQLIMTMIGDYLEFDYYGHRDWNFLWQLSFTIQLSVTFLIVLYYAFFTKGIGASPFLPTENWAIIDSEHSNNLVDSTSA